MKATWSVMALCAVLVLSGCAGMRDKWSGNKSGMDGSASAGSMNGAAGHAPVSGAESSIGNGSASDVGNKALDRGTGDTR